MVAKNHVGDKTKNAGKEIKMHPSGGYKCVNLHPHFKPTHFYAGLWSSASQKLFNLTIGNVKKFQHITVYGWF